MVALAEANGAPMSRLLPCVLTLALACACSGVSSQAYTLDGSLPFRGYTRCGAEQCEPNTYCENAEFSACHPGCLGDDNCAVGQECSPGGYGGANTCQTAQPGAKEGSRCTSAGYCEGGRFYCFLGEGDQEGTCRALCNRSYDCSALTGRYGDDCCKVGGVTLAVCLPSAVAPASCTGF